VVEDMRQHPPWALPVRVRVIAPLDLVWFAFFGLLSSKTCAWEPDLILKLLQSGLGMPVIMVGRLVASDAPSLAWSWFGSLCASSTVALTIVFGTLWQGEPCTVRLTRSLIVLMDLSTS
jgi:hypothetical protein